VIPASKWDKFQLGITNTQIWVFIKGRMFVINEAEYEHKNDKIIKNINEGNFISKAKERIK
jgi:hypothetical protein